MRQKIYNSHKKRGLDFDKSLQSSGAFVFWHQPVYYLLFWELCALWFCSLWPKHSSSLQSSSSWNLHFAFLLRGQAAVEIYTAQKVK